MRSRRGKGDLKFYSQSAALTAEGGGTFSAAFRVNYPRVAVWSALLKSTEVSVTLPRQEAAQKGFRRLAPGKAKSLLAAYPPVYVQKAISLLKGTRCSLALPRVGFVQIHK